MMMLPGDLAQRFRGHCQDCVGLCCVALSRSTLDGFGSDGAAGEPCQHLMGDHRCEIHSRLRSAGWPACTVFDCFGAGQQAVAMMREKRGAGREPAIDGETGLLFELFRALRPLMEMLRHLHEAKTLCSGRADVEGLLEELEAVLYLSPEEILQLQVGELRSRVGAALAKVSSTVRGPQADERVFHPGAQLLGAALSGRDLSGKCLRGAYLIAADLRGSTLFRTDLLGADLRDARLQGADLSSALFLTDPQVASADGDDLTRLPAHITRPAHWSSR